KFMYVFLAVIFFVTFAFLGVGSGTNGGLDQLFSGINIFKSDGPSISSAEKATAKHPNDPKGYRDLATAYEKHDQTANAIAALQRYTSLKPKDVAAWNELGGLQVQQAQTYQAGYESAYQNQQLAAPSQPFLPTGKLGTGVGSNPIENASAQQASDAT